MDSLRHSPCSDRPLGRALHRELVVVSLAEGSMFLLILRSGWCQYGYFGPAAMFAFGTALFRYVLLNQVELTLLDYGRTLAALARLRTKLKGGLSVRLVFTSRKVFSRPLAEDRIAYASLIKCSNVTDKLTEPIFLAVHTYPADPGPRAPTCSSRTSAAISATHA